MDEAEPCASLTRGQFLLNQLFDSVQITHVAEGFHQKLFRILDDLLWHVVVLGAVFVEFDIVVG